MALLLLDCAQCVGLRRFYLINGRVPRIGNAGQTLGISLKGWPPSSPRPSGSLVLRIGASVGQATFNRCPPRAGKILKSLWSPVSTARTRRSSCRPRTQIGWRRDKDRFLAVGVSLFLQVVFNGSRRGEPGFGHKKGRHNGVNLTAAEMPPKLHAYWARRLRSARARRTRGGIVGASAGCYDLLLPVSQGIDSTSFLETAAASREAEFCR
jgi:hypothetical protein